MVIWLSWKWFHWMNDQITDWFDEIHIMSSHKANHFLRVNWKMRFSKNVRVIKWKRSNDRSKQIRLTSCVLIDMFSFQFIICNGKFFTCPKLKPNWNMKSINVLNSDDGDSIYHLIKYWWGESFWAFFYGNGLNWKSLLKTLNIFKIYAKER